MTALLDAESVLYLGGDAAQVVHDVANELASIAGRQVDAPEWVAAARAAWEDLPTALRRQVREFKRYSGPSGMILVRGLPVAAVMPRTPSVAGSVQRSPSESAAILLMFAAGLGDPVAYRSEKSGALVQDVVPVPGREELQSNAGSVTLGFHVENAFHPHRPDYVALLCLRSDHERAVGLKVSCIRRFLMLLSPASRQALCRPEFRTAPPPSFGGLGAPGGEHAVVSHSGEDPDLVVDLEATEPLTPQAWDALRELGDLFERTAQTVCLETGDLAIVDNRVAVHGRTGFQPRYDGMDRWLQRTFIAADLRRSRIWRPGDGYVLANSPGSAL
jgi:L-asparagine oxygenase